MTRSPQAPDGRVAGATPSSSGLTRRATRPDLTRPDAPPPTLPARLLLALIALYQLTSAWRAPRCRFLPTCSTFAADAIRVHGPGRGSWLALRRIGRCHPWHPGGLDPVPTPRK